MKIKLGLLAALIIVAISSCTSGGNPLSNSPDALTQNESQNATAATQTHLWGYYDVYIDIENQTATAIENRHGMFAANVVSFLNTKPNTMVVQILSIIMQNGATDVDMNLTLKHPFSGLPQYNGYDVRGIILTDGSAMMASNTALKYGAAGVDQICIDDPTFGGPDQPGGGADGYSRWWNRPEFTVPGTLGYTKGIYASSGYLPTATLNPYKYFASGMGPFDNAITWLKANPASQGLFPSGGQCTRNYYLRFPMTKGVKFGYAVVANWLELTQPANAPEALALGTNVTPNIYYVDPATKGGNLILDLEVFDWGNHVLQGGVMTDYTITLESTVLSAPHTFTTPEMTPTAHVGNTYTYHLDIPADNINGTTGNEYWVLVSYANYDYTNTFGVPNAAGTAPLTAVFRNDLPVSNQLPSPKPICNVIVDSESPAMPFDGWGAFGFDASGSTDPNGEVLSFSWDFNNDGTFGDTYDVGTDVHPIIVPDFTNQSQVCVRVSNVSGGMSECCVDVDFIGHATKNIPLESGLIAKDLAVNPVTGDILVAFSDGEVYSYARSMYYQAGSLFTASPEPIESGPIYIETNKEQYSVITASVNPTWVYTTVSIYTPSGEVAIGPISNSGCPSPCDALAMVGGTWDDQLAVLHGEPYGGNTYYLELHRYPQGIWFPPETNAFFSTTPPYNGYNNMNPLTVDAATSDTTGDYIWCMKNENTVGGQDNWCSRWHLNSPTTMVYDNAYFGTGLKSDDDSSWNDARDLTRDLLNRYFILDKLSTGDPRIKVWTVSGNITTSIGHFGNLTNISGDPLRIEGSDYEDIIVVLHGATSPQNISVFLSREMP